MENNTVQFDDFTDAACVFSDTYDELENDYKSIGIVAKYDEAKEIIKELLCLGHDIKSIEIHDCEYEDYFDEYVVTITNDGIYCEKFKCENGYFCEESDVTYVSNECNSICFKHIDSDIVYAFQIGDDECYECDECLENCSDCNDCCDCENDMHGLTITKTTDNGYSTISFYSTENFKSDELKRFMDIFNLYNSNDL